MTDANSPSDGAERYIAAATQHGEDSDPDHEVGDLQQYLRVAFRLMTPEQRTAFAADAEVEELIAIAHG